MVEDLNLHIHFRVVLQLLILKKIMKTDILLKKKSNIQNFGWIISYSHNYILKIAVYQIYNSLYTFIYEFNINIRKHEWQSSIESQLKQMVTHLYGNFIHGFWPGWF